MINMVYFVKVLFYPWKDMTIEDIIKNLELKSSKHLIMSMYL
jgi:hypothetical protein